MVILQRPLHPQFSAGHFRVPSAPKLAFPASFHLLSWQQFPLPQLFKHLARRRPTMSKGFAFSFLFTTFPRRVQDGSLNNQQFHWLVGWTLQSLSWPQTPEKSTQHCPRTAATLRTETETRGEELLLPSTKPGPGSHSDCSPRPPTPTQLCPAAGTPFQKHKQTLVIPQA